MYDPNAMCVAYASDDAYAPYMGISMRSLLQSNQEAESITVFVLDNGIRPENVEKLKQTADEFGRELLFIAAKEYLDRLKLNLGARKISVVSYARLFLSSIIPDKFDRLIYIDCDTVVCDSLLPMWQTELGDALVAGVQDTVDTFFLKKIGLPLQTRYVNAGVILINLALWRKENIEETFLRYIDEQGGNVPHHDQGCINHVSGERRVILPLRYNVTANMFSFTEKMIRKMYFLSGEYYTQEEIDASTAHPALLHYTTGLLGRPWEENCSHPRKSAYTDAEAASLWNGLGVKPDSKSFPLKTAAFVCRHAPGLFALIYRCSSWVLHLRR